MSVRVLVVDDSAFMRKVITEIIGAEPDLEVVGYARNGEDALKKLSRLQVDVITLDVEMPVMDGLETLKRIMNENPRPVVMLSSRTRKGSDTTMQALSLGAVDFVSKPTGSAAPDLHSIAEKLVSKIRCAAMAQLPRKKRVPAAAPPKGPLPVLPPVPAGAASRIVIIGSSTGGPKALEEVFAHIPANLPAGIVVVQHMPKDFTRSFADRLNSLFPFPVKEAQNGDLVENGKVLIAPGDYHLVITPERRVELNQEDRVMFLRPAIDVTMESLPGVYGRNIIGVILTGMGRDGAKGMAKIKQAGGITIAQDQATSTIYSMPKAVAEEGHADYILPLERIGGVITELVAALG